MLGVDTNWVSTSTRAVQYPTMPPNNYTFEIKAKNEDGIWSKPRTLSFSIFPPFWFTWWFIGLEILFGIGIISAIFWYREKQNRTKSASEKRMVESELKALRSQMNPHFTFNTLNAIQLAVETSDRLVASKYIGDFAVLIRKVLENSKHSSISLEEEISMLKLYIELEQFRFSNKFLFEIIVEEDLDLNFIRIPAMVIQPFVENAILHGLAPKEGEGKLTLKLYEKEDAIHCVIEDNGVGRERAMEIKKLKKFSHKSMAMEITEERMDLYNKGLNDAFSIKIIDLKDDNNIPQGTRLELEFPS
jgi:LytS/YehU family sensor histidine kinase